MIKNNADSKQEPRLNWKLLPLQFVLCVLPLILYVFMLDSGGLIESLYIDVFLHGKMIAFMLVSVVTLVLAIWKLVKMEKESRRKSLSCFLPLFLYLFFVLLSTICSENISYSVFGSMDAKEPVGVLAGYVVVALYAYVVIDSMQDVIQLTMAAVYGSFLMVFVGLMQTIGKDLLAMEGVQRLFASADFLDTYGALKLTFPVGQAYGTLFNPNYVGTYVAMYVPLLLVGIVMCQQWWKKLACGASVLGLLVMLFASQSRTGLIAAVAVLVVLAVFMGRELMKRWYVIIPAGVLLIVGFLILDASRDHLLTTRLKEMFTLEPSEDPVSGVDTTGNGVRVLYKDTEFTVMMPVADGSFAFAALEGAEQREVTYDDSGSYGYFTLDNGDVITIQLANFENEYAFGLEINDRNFYFTNQIVAGNYKYINDVMGRLDECIIPENVFPGYEAAASGRGYVWGRTIPLLKENLIIGSGPDTFVIEFPQDDYVARYKSAFDSVIFTRPHNFYLQMGVQTGVVSLIAFLVFYAKYFVECCRRYFIKKFTGMEQWFGFAIFLSTVGFMVAGLANDSLIVVTPVFYVLLGLGMIVNHKMCPVEKKVKKKKGLE